MDNSILDHSPALAGLLRRTFPDVAVEIFAPKFSWSYEQGGAVEYGFKRAYGVSFNPRLARVAMILITDAEIREVQTVNACLLSCASRSAIIPERFEEAPLACAARELLFEISQFQNTIQNPNVDDSELPAARVIVLAQVVDLLRHSHLVSRADTDSEVKKLYDEIVFSLPVIEAWCVEEYPRLSQLLGRWRERNVRE